MFTGFTCLQFLHVYRFYKNYIFTGFTKIIDFTRGTVWKYSIFYCNYLKITGFKRITKNTGFIRVTV